MGEVLRGFQEAVEGSLKKSRELFGK